MATMKNLILGNLSGSISDIVFRIRNGKPYASSKPSKVTISDTPAAVLQRERMAFVSPFAKALIQDFLVNFLWKNSSEKGENARQRVISKNFCRYQPGDGLAGLKMLPGDELLNFAVESFALIADSLSVTVFPIETDATEMRYPGISAHVIMLLEQPLNENDKLFRFISISSGTINFVKNSSLTFSLPIDNQDHQTIMEYSKITFGISVILSDSSKCPGIWGSAEVGMC